VIDFYYWPTPNGWKVSIMLEESGLPYTLKPVNIGAGDQFTPAFMSISPNARMPAVVDHDAPDGPLPVFESGAILIHLAEKSGRFMPTTAKGRKECLEWLFWQVGNLGPMAGQLSHFVNYAKSVQEGDHRYASNRLGCNPVRPTGVPARQGTGCIRRHTACEQSLADFPNLSGWRERIKSRPACNVGSIWERKCGAPASIPTKHGRSCSARRLSL
jgi:GST-like protein